MIEITPPVRNLDIPWGRFLIDAIPITVQYPEQAAENNTYAGLMDMMIGKYRARKSKSKNATLRSMHINGSGEIDILRDTFSKIEYETEIHTTLSSLSTYSRATHETIKNKSMWITGVDGTGQVNAGNMRAWKNRMSTFGEVGVITANCARYPYGKLGIPAANSLAFVLMNLPTNGYAYVTFDDFSPGTLALLYICSMCFNRSYIQKVSDRNMFVGECFIGFKAKFHKYLYDLCENNFDLPDMIPFDITYVESPDFCNFLNVLKNTA